MSHNTINNNFNNNKKCKNIDKNGKNIYLSLNIHTLNPNNTFIYPSTYNYIKDLVKTIHNVNNLISKVMSIGNTRNDSILCIGNLFKIAVCMNKANIIQYIKNYLKDHEFNFIINAFYNNYTPIMHSVFNCSKECTILLLFWNVDINIKNINNETVFDALNEGLKSCNKKYPHLIMFNQNTYDELLLILNNHINNFNNNNNDNNIDNNIDNNNIDINDNNININDIENNVCYFIDNDISTKIEQIINFLIDKSNDTTYKHKDTCSNIINSILSKYNDYLSSEYPRLYQKLTNVHICQS